MGICQTHSAPRPLWRPILVSKTITYMPTRSHTDTPTLIGCGLLIWTCQLRDSTDRHCGKRKDILLLLCYVWLPRPCSPESFHFLNVYRAVPNNALKQRDELQEFKDAGRVVQSWRRKDIERHGRLWGLEKREREKWRLKRKEESEKEGERA